MMFVRQFAIFSIMLFGFAPLATANNSCALGEKWIPIERDIVWSDYVHTPEANNQVQLLNVWAIWCAPCRKELPILAKLDATPNIGVHLLNMGDDPAQAQTVLESLAVTSISTGRTANDDVLKAFDVAGIPLTVMFIDNKATFRYLGILDDETEIERYAECLAEKTP